MLRFRAKTMPLGMGRRVLDPRWMNLPPSTGHRPGVHKTSKKSPPMSGSSWPPPPLPARRSEAGTLPSAGFLQISSPSGGVPLPSPPANPARCCVQTDNCSGPSSASCPSSRVVPHSPSAGVLVASPRPGVRLLSAPAGHARSIGTNKWLSPPPGAGHMLLSPGAGVPLPSRPQINGRSGIGRYKSYRSPYSHGLGSAGIVKSYQPHQSNASSGMGTDRSFQPSSMLCLSTGLMPPASQASVSLMSPTENLECGGVGMDKCLQAPTPSMLGSNLSQQLAAPWGNPTPSRVCVGSWPRPPYYAGKNSGLSNLSTVLSNTDCRLGNILYRRSFSTLWNAGDQEACMEPIKANSAPRMIRYSKLQERPELKMFSTKFIKSSKILGSVDEDIELVKSEMFDLDKLMELYSDLVKDVVVASGLHISHEYSDDTYVRDLMEKLYSALDKNYLRLITSLDLMKALVPLPKWKWSHLIEYLRDAKVMVLERWDLSLAPIETMVYNKGWKVKLDGQLYKGQADASYKKGLATLCSIIWEDEDQVKDCCVCVDVPCNNATEAELLSMYMLERRGIDLGVKNMLGITDNDHVCKVLNERIIPSGDLENLGKTIVGLKSKFETFLCHLEPREQLLFPDSLATLTLEYLCKLKFEEVVRAWSRHLSGLPLFRVHQSERQNEKILGKMSNGGKLTVHPVYKVKVNDESGKIDAIKNVLLSVCPKFASIELNDEEIALSLEKELITMYTKTQVKLVKQGKNYLVNVHTRLDSQDKTSLRICFDSSIKDVFKEKTVNVRLLLKKEDNPGIQNLAPECYLFFNGVAGDRLQMGENIIKPKPKSQAKSNGKSQAKSNGKSNGKGKGKAKPE